VHQVYRHAGRWGVEHHNAIVYDPLFSRPEAQQIADMLNSDNPPADWYETERRLKQLSVKRNQKGYHTPQR
jgi:hypothetical protein